MRTPKLLVLVGAVMFAACGGGSDTPEVSNVRIGQPTGPNAALYMTVDGYGTDDVLTGATTDVAREVQVHEAVMKDDGTMGMNHIGTLDLASDGEIVLEPGGYHLMLLDVERLEVGEMVDVTLHWDVAGDMDIQAEVVAPGDTGG